MLTICLVLSAGVLLGYASGSIVALSLACLSLALAACFGPAVLFGMSGPVLAIALLCALQSAFVLGGMVYALSETTADLIA